MEAFSRTVTIPRCALHDLLDNRETESGARNRISLCAPKPLKNPFPLLRRNAISSVGDTYTAVAIHPYRDLLSSRRVDDRVFQQVSQCGFDGICIAAHENRPTSGVETDRAALLDRPRCHCGHDARSDFVEVDNRRYIERDGVEPSDEQKWVTIRFIRATSPFSFDNRGSSRIESNAVVMIDKGVRSS